MDALGVFKAELDILKGNKKTQEGFQDNTKRQVAKVWDKVKKAPGGCRTTTMITYLSVSPTINELNESKASC